MLKYYEDQLAIIDQRIADGIAVAHHQQLRPHYEQRVAEEQAKLAENEPA